jgi:hypothetical protein
VSDFLEIACPSCHRPNLVDGSEIPAEGAYRACASCGSQIRVQRSGEAERAAPVKEVSEEEEGLGVFLKMPTGAVERLSHDAVEQGIQMRRILPWDLLSDDSRDFRPASQHPEFRNLFLPSDHAPVIQPRCANHADAPAAATCRKCGRSYCDRCVASLMRIEPRLCPACNGVAAEPDARLRETPPWQRAEGVARFPIDQNAWVVTLAIGIVFWLSRSTLLATPLSLLTLPLFVDAILRSAKGVKHWTILTGGVDQKELVQKTLPVALLYVVAALPFLAFGFVFGAALGVLFQFPWTLFLFFYGPMAVGLALFAPDTDRALKPRTVFDAIWAVRDEYFVYVLVLIAIAVAVVAVNVALTFIPWIGPLLQSLALAYGVVVQAHLLGFFLYMNRERVLAAA